MAGRADGSAEAAIVLLTARGVAVDSATRARILAERDAQRLDRWIVRAASCTQAAELFTDGRPRIAPAPGRVVPPVC